MPSVDELLEKAESQIVDDTLYIDVESRQIQVPSTEILFGVENDKKAERKYFRCPKKVGNNLDLENANIYVNYQNANGEKDSYIVSEIEDTKEEVHARMIPPAPEGEDLGGITYEEREKIAKK